MDAHWPYHLEAELVAPEAIARAWHDLSELHVMQRGGLVNVFQHQTRYPEVSLEMIFNTMWTFDREQARLDILESARKAGIRICATQAELATLGSPLELSECSQGRRGG